MGKYCKVMRCLLLLLVYLFICYQLSLNLPQSEFAGQRSVRTGAPVDFVNHNKSHLSERLPRCNYITRYRNNKLYVQGGFSGAKPTPPKLVTEEGLQLAINKYLSQQIHETAGAQMLLQPADSMNKPFKISNDAVTSMNNHSQSLKADASPKNVRRKAQLVQDMPFNTDAYFQSNGLVKLQKECAQLQFYLFVCCFCMPNSLSPRHAQHVPLDAQYDDIFQQQSIGSHSFFNPIQKQSFGNNPQTHLLATNNNQQLKQLENLHFDPTFPDRNVSMDNTHTVCAI